MGDGAPTIDYRPSPRYHADGVGVYFGSSQDSRLLYDGTNDEWTVQTKDSGGTQTDRVKVVSGGDITTVELYNDDPGADGIRQDVHHESASPAASDVPYHLRVYGEDDADNKEQYAGLKVTILDPATGSEDSKVGVEVVTAGTVRVIETPVVTADDVFAVLTLAQTFEGAQTFNAGVLITTANGLDVNPGSDIDADLITIGVTGAPKMWWDESKSSVIFSSGNGVQVTAGAGVDVTVMAENTAANQEARFRAHGAAAATAPFGYQFHQGSGSGAADNMGYQIDYLGTGPYLRLRSTDTDGSSTDADIWRVTDGGEVMILNANHGANFDYVCEECGRSSGSPFICHSVQAPWHDDVALMTHATQRDVGNMPVRARDQLERLGLLVVDRRPDQLLDGQPQQFLSLNRMPWFLMSGIVQTRERLDEANERIASLESQVATMSQHRRG